VATYLAGKVTHRDIQPGDLRYRAGQEIVLQRQRDRVLAGRVLLRLPIAALGHLERRERLGKEREARTDQLDIGRRRSSEKPLDRSTMHIDDIQDRELCPERLAAEQMRRFELDLMSRVHEPPEPRLVAHYKTARLPIHNADVTLSTSQKQTHRGWSAP
jgi:hypothetical protein